jgi:membrane dipeptidase
MIFQRAWRVGLALAFSCTMARAETEAELAARAAAVHARVFTLDSHLDTPTYSLRRSGWNIAERHAWVGDFSQCDFPRMRAGGLDAAVFVVYVDPLPRTPAGRAASRDSALRTFLRIHTMAARHAADCELAFTADDGPRIAASGKRAIYLSIENGEAIGQDLSLLKTYFDLGARFFGVAHSANTELADSATAPKGPEWNGLSPLGREAVAECNRLGLVLDGSHASDAAVREMVALSATPILLTHSSCRALRDHPRNASDELLRAIAAKGGVIQMNSVSLFLVPSVPSPELAAAEAKRNQALAGRTLSDEEDAEEFRARLRLKHELGRGRATRDDFLKHLFHAIDLVGVDHVGIGADMDGGGGVAGLEDVSQYPKITHALLARGLSEEAVAKIWGGNTLRVLRAAEAHAKAVAAVRP